MKPGMEIGELASASGVTRRTIRYYVALGLLPPGEEAGRSRFFNAEHMLRLNVIRKLKDQFLPLEEIRKRMATMTRSEMHELAGIESHARRAPVNVIMSAPPKMCEPCDHPRPVMAMNLNAPLDRESSDSNVRDRGFWSRIELCPGVELNVNLNAPNDAQALVEKIKRLARSHRKPGYREPETGSD